MSLIGSQAIIAAARRCWWAVPIIGLLLWALALRGDLAQARAALSAEQFAHQRSALNWQIATATALATDLQNRVAQERRQAEESRRIADDYEARIADARARAAGLAADRVRSEAAAADPGGRGNAPVPGVPDPARLADEAAGEDRLSTADALIATEQAIQLDALIDWVEAQAAVAAGGSR
jgi:hypothetical protein